jgi:hypothetical protein
MNFSNLTMMPPMATTFTFDDGREPVFAVHPLMTVGEPVECESVQYRVNSLTMVADENGSRQTIALTRLSPSTDVG